MPKKHRFRRSKSTLPAEGPGAVVGAVVSVNRRKRPWRLWLLIGAAVALIGGGVFLLVRDKQPEQPKVVVTEEGVKLKKLNSEQLQDELEKLIFQKKFSSAEQLIEYQDNANSNEHKMFLVGTYLSQNKPQDALRILKDLESQNPNEWRLASTIGDVYRSMGDKPNALVYYKKALALLEKTDPNKVPVRDDEILSLEQDISEVEGQE